MEVMVKRKRAAAYCRVSTDMEMQEGSFEWQKRHYMELLSGNLDVELVQVYGDEGCSGRYADRRPEFQQMLKDCEDGKIDVIYTKSISRFSRNLADCVTVIRRLKELGISSITGWTTWWSAWNSVVTRCGCSGNAVWRAKCR